MRFQEKPKLGESWINGGYFVLSPQVIDYIDDDLTIWEKQPLEQLAKEGQLSAYKHTGFWKPMDTLRDRNALEELWQTDNPPWKIW
jgi:glucose-1-phosphate cytidylyltransferase